MRSDCIQCCLHFRYFVHFNIEMYMISQLLWSLDICVIFSYFDGYIHRLNSRTRLSVGFSLTLFQYPLLPLTLNSFIYSITRFAQPNHRITYMPSFFTMLVRILHSLNCCCLTKAFCKTPWIFSRRTEEINGII